MKRGDKVETPNGVGVIEDVRQQGKEIVYLVCTGFAGFGGVRDVYSADELATLEKSNP